MKQKHSLANLETYLLPIERAPELDQRFDHIICTGVLHHLADPEAGLQALKSVLKPNGVMYLMVYAPYGRTGVYMILEYCRRLGIGTSQQEIRDLISTLKLHPQNHPLLATLGGSREFNEDALFEAIDGRRNVSEIVDDLKKGSALKAKEASRIARAFFEKLWWYDQVVFDTSPAS